MLRIYYSLNIVRQLVVAGGCDKVAQEITTGHQSRSLSRAGDKRVAQARPDVTRDAPKGSTFSFQVLCLKTHGTSMVGDIMMCLTRILFSLDTERQQRTEVVIPFWPQKGLEGSKKADERQQNTMNSDEQCWYLVATWDQPRAGVSRRRLLGFAPKATGRLKEFNSIGILGDFCSSCEGQVIGIKLKINTYLR